ncbi:hypothetical protein PIB30_079770 [Stylosanthes scabra]|uniref:Uncharacterized protein n=1 Tax=Stylosanthes scabra TaxID=79078 RepID=A0ABU6RR24_9FABA|nr:hypothetical protein [Stylosanthes scabra]
MVGPVWLGRLDTGRVRSNRIPFLGMGSPMVLGTGSMCYGYGLRGRSPVSKQIIYFFDDNATYMGDKILPIKLSHWYDNDLICQRTRVYERTEQSMGCLDMYGCHDGCR